MDSCLAIYPTARKVTEVLKRRSRAGGLVGHRVTTFPQLVDALWAELAPASASLSPLGERIALRAALRRRPRQTLSGIEDRPALIGHLMGLVSQFKSAWLEPTDLLEAGAVLSRQDAERLGEIAAVFDDYGQLLRQRRLADAVDRERAVVEMLHDLEKSGRRPRWLNGVRRLMVAEIYDFSLLQFLIVTSLIRIIGDAQLTIQAAEHQVDAARFAELTWNRFVSEESIADMAVPEFVCREGRAGRLGFLLKNLFSLNRPANSPPPCDGTVSVIKAPDRLREIETVGREIRRVLEQPAGELLACSRIAVIARDLGPYVGHLESVFARYRIPLSIDGAPALRSTPAAGQVLEMLSLCASGLPRAGLLRLLGSPDVRIDAGRYGDLLAESGYIDAGTRALVDCLEALARQSAQAAEHAGADEERARHSSKLQRIRDAQRAFAQLLAVLAPLAENCPAAEHLGRLADALAALRFGATFVPSPCSPDGFRRSLGPVLGALADLATSAAMVGLDEPISPREFAHLAEAAFDEVKLGNRDGAEQAVQALTVKDARGLDFDLVFIIGLNDGVFPLHHRDSPLLRDAAVAALNGPVSRCLRQRLGPKAPSYLGGLLRTSAQRNAEEAFLFFLGASMPTSRLVLSCALSDRGARPLQISPFLGEVIDLISSESDNRDLMQTAPGEEFIAPFEHCFSPGEFLNRAALESVLARPQMAAVAPAAAIGWIAARTEVERHRESYFSRPARERTEGGGSDEQRLAMTGPYDGRVSPSDRMRRAIIGTPGKWKPLSAKSINEMAACGFRFFAARVLGLAKPDEEVGHEPGVLETGEMVHGVLRELFAARLDLSSVEAALAQTKGLLAELRACYLATARDTRFFALLWRTVERIVEELIAFEVERRASGGNPEMRLEWDFEFPLRSPASPLSAERIELRLCGRIDRIELYRGPDNRIEKICVLDYKTSGRADHYAKQADPEGDKFGVTDFQLATYLMAVWQRFKAELAPGAELRCGYVVLRHRDKLKEYVCPPQRIENEPRLGSASPGMVADGVRALVRDALAGNFDVDPLACDEYCPYRAICRYRKLAGPG